MDLFSNMLKGSNFFIVLSLGVFDTICKEIRCNANKFMCYIVTTNLFSKRTEVST